MKGFILSIIAALLILILWAVGLLVKVVMYFVKDSREKYGHGQGDRYWYEVAYAIDVLGNTVCSELFNITLIKHGGYRFGKRGETISSVLGKNMMGRTLSKTGRVVVKILDTIEDNHCLIAIQE